MAQFSCLACGHQGHFVEFKSGEHVEPSDPDDDSSEDVSVDELECPECQSSSVCED